MDSLLGPDPLPHPGGRHNVTTAAPGDPASDRPIPLPAAIAEAVVLSAAGAAVAGESEAALRRIDAGAARLQAAPAADFGSTRTRRARARIPALGPGAALAVVATVCLNTQAAPCLAGGRAVRWRTNRRPGLTGRLAACIGSGIALALEGQAARNLTDGAESDNLVRRRIVSVDAN